MWLWKPELLVTVKVIVPDIDNSLRATFATGTETVVEKGYGSGS